ncbi:hypothetical protein SAMD00023353_2201500 [Rosellinia necatrix]|uniref:Uncharacterized protein n=1 Tax=Rosellinia necatrix TaxID=77044 RepID=A0A1S7UP54_ROSNE|nr:hypothetical protein SAMD00023353_2201500 [Rosellinia necatrix]
MSDTPTLFYEAQGEQAICPGALPADEIDGVSHVNALLHELQVLDDIQFTADVHDMLLLSEARFARSTRPSRWGRVAHYVKAPFRESRAVWKGVQAMLGMQRLSEAIRARLESRSRNPYNKGMAGAASTDTEWLDWDSRATSDTTWAGTDSPTTGIGLKGESTLSLWQARHLTHVGNSRRPLGGNAWGCI